MLTRVKNQHGSVLIMALVASAVLSALTVMGLSVIQRTDQLSVLPRVRSNMAQLELKVRQLAHNPNSYSGCQVLVGANTCTLKTNLFTSLDSKWAKVTNINFNPANQTLHAEIIANDTKFSIKPRVLDIRVPNEVLTEVTFQCPDTEPFFVGFDSAGAAVCRPVPSTACPTGQYLQSVNPVTLEPTCVPIGSTVACPYGQKIASFTWVGGTTVNSSCIPRPAPALP